MRCPFCGSRETRVLDSRDVRDGEAIRRRRICESCERRFTTYEVFEQPELMVIKRDGRRERFDPRKLRDKLHIALTKRPVSVDEIDRIVRETEAELLDRGYIEAPSTVIGETVLEKLLVQTGASRVTLRQDLPGEYAFPVTAEALAPGVGSLREERTVDLRGQPVAIEVSSGRQVVQGDSATAYDDPAFHRMRETYGGLAAQIVTPVLVDGRVAGIVSVHELRAPRQWTEGEIAACRAAAARIAGLF